MQHNSSPRLSIKHAGIHESVEPLTALDTPTLEDEIVKPGLTKANVVPVRFLQAEVAQLRGFHAALGEFQALADSATPCQTMQAQGCQLGILEVTALPNHVVQVGVFPGALFETTVDKARGTHCTEATALKGHVLEMPVREQICMQILIDEDRVLHPLLRGPCMHHLQRWIL